MHTTWQADLSRRPFADPTGAPLWELLVCSEDGSWQFSAQAPQKEIDGKWVNMQLAIALTDWPGHEHESPLEESPLDESLPEKIQVFRPQSFSLIAAGAEPLGIQVEPTRHTPALKQILQDLQKSTAHPDWDPVKIEEMPPQPLPDRLQGDRWRFAALPAGELISSFQHRPIPVVELPESRSPLGLGLPSTQPIPGMIIDGGRASMQLARWLLTVRPHALKYVAGAPDGVILQAGLAERWVMATFDDMDVAEAARVFQQRQSDAQGLHFVLVQPDDSGITYSGVWLLQQS